MNIEAENALLKRQLEAATTALERIKGRQHVPRYADPAEVAGQALADIFRISKEGNPYPSWGVKFEEVGDGWRASFFVEQQSFTLFENQEPDSAEDALDHAKWFWDMFKHALVRIVVNVALAKELTQPG